MRAGAGGQLDRRWWLAEEAKEHQRLMPVVERLRRQDATRRANVLRHQRMYGSYTAARQYGAAAPDLPPDRLRYNVCQQAVDTLVAEITSSKPKASFLTTGGDWTLRQAAKQRELVVEGQMRAAGIYSGLARQVQRDAQLAGTGFGEVYIDWATLTPKIERVLPLEVLVDEADARYGAPRSLYRQRLVDRAVLREMYGDDAATRQAIDDAPRYTGDADTAWVLEDTTESDLVLVVKAWHLPSSPTAKDGRFVVAIQDATLHSCAFTRDRFPIVPLTWGEPPSGFFGTGVVAMLEADQIELNKTLRRIQEAAGVAAGVWLLERGARVRQTHLTDVPGAQIQYSGVKPEYLTPATVPSDLVMHADRIIQRALGRLGISEMFAQALKPAGLNSGEAQRVHADVFSRRQIEHVQNYEAWHIEVARAFVDANEEILAYLDELPEAKRRRLPDVPVQVKRGRRTVLQRLRFDEANLPENAWVLQPFPMSSLPSEPSGRMARITEWVQGGLIDPTMAKALLDIPDIESAVDLELADFDFALWAFETMVEDGEYISPEPYQQLELGLELMRKCYLRAQIDGVPDARLDLVRDHMTAIKRLMDKAAQPAPAAPVAPGAGMAAPVGSAPAPELAGALPNTLPVAA